MKTPKNYFHDKAVLLLLSLSAFTAVLSSLYIALRVNFDEPYIIAYRGMQAREPFVRADATEFWFFIVFAFLTLFVHWFISMKMYYKRRRFSYAFLFIGFMLLLFNAVVSNALIGSPL